MGASDKLAKSLSTAIQKEAEAMLKRKKVVNGAVNIQTNNDSIKVPALITTLRCHWRISIICHVIDLLRVRAAILSKAMHLHCSGLTYCRSIADGNDVRPWKPPKSFAYGIVCYGCSSVWASTRTGSARWWQASKCSIHIIYLWGLIWDPIHLAHKPKPVKISIMHCDRRWRPSGYHLKPQKP